MQFAHLVTWFPTLLYMYWGLAAGAALVALLPLKRASSFRAAVVLSACRGKLWETRPKAGLGPLEDVTVSQQYFSHFYLLGAIWNMVLLARALQFSVRSEPMSDQVMGEPPVQAASLLGLALLQVHLTRRLLESAFMAKYPPSARMHVIAYIFGLSYYFVLPLSIMPLEAYRIKSWPKALPMKLVWPEQLKVALGHVQWQHILGTVIFLLGNVLQYQSHAILAALASTAAASRAGRSQSRYQIPKGGLFDYVSCPHYLGEIVIYLGLLVLLGRQNALTSLIFAWVVFNLLLAAKPTHVWYQQNFKSYPKRRKALVPFLY